MGVADRLVHRFLGDLVEDDAADRHLGLQHLFQVPGDGFAFAIRVGREKDFRRVLDRGSERRDVFLLVRGDDVVRREVAVDVDGHAAPGLVLDGRRDLAGAFRQIADVPEARLDAVSIPEEPRQGFRFGWRLDDDQRLRHDLLLPYHR